MAKLEYVYCERCSTITEHTWVYDRDSDPEEPQFMLICVYCELKASCVDYNHEPVVK